jgi:hypothetical protein
VKNPNSGVDYDIQADKQAKLVIRYGFKVFAAKDFC